MSYYYPSLGHKWQAYMEHFFILFYYNLQLWQQNELYVYIRIVHSCVFMLFGTLERIWKLNSAIDSEMLFTLSLDTVDIYICVERSGVPLWKYGVLSMNAISQWPCDSYSLYPWEICFHLTLYPWERRLSGCDYTVLYHIQTWESNWEVKLPLV